MSQYEREHKLKHKTKSHKVQPVYFNMYCVTKLHHTRGQAFDPTQFAYISNILSLAATTRPNDPQGFLILRLSIPLYMRILTVCFKDIY
jgi:hypothetical protein